MPYPKINRFDKPPASNVAPTTLTVCFHNIGFFCAFVLLYGNSFLFGLITLVAAAVTAVTVYIVLMTTHNARYDRARNARQTKCVWWSMARC